MFEFKGTDGRGPRRYEDLLRLVGVTFKCDPITE